MRYVFFGTPRFAEIILQKLINAGMIPALVVCNPDRPVGRKKIITPPPVKELVARAELDIELMQPEKFDAEFIEEISLIKPEYAVIAAYGKIIPKSILDIPSLGTIGVHPSFLPRYRGASPIQSAILTGDKETGVTLYLVDEKVDHGPMIAQSKPVNAERKTYEELEKELAEMGAELLIEKLKRGSFNPVPQDESLATFTKKFGTEDGLVDLSKDDPRLIAQKIRALGDEPGVYTMQNGKRMKLLEVKEFNGKIVITKTQLEGKNPQPAEIELTK